MSETLLGKTRSGKTFKRKTSQSPPPKKRIKAMVPKIKAMVLLINAHGNIVVNLKDSFELDEFKEIITTGYENNFTIKETFIIEDDEQDPPIEKIGGPVEYENNGEELTPYMWIADVITVPENVNFYAVNVPCAVGYKTPYRNNPHCWKGLCREEGFTVWQDNLTNANLISEMQKLWEHYNLGLSSQRLREYYASTIHADSIRQNPSVLPLPPIKKVLQKELQTQSSDSISKNDIKLQIFTEEGKTTYTLLDIFDVTNEIDFPELKKDYPKCRTQINNYIDKIEYYVRISDNANLFDITLSQILELLFSLVDKYGDDTDIYMVDHSCFNLATSSSAEGEVKKDIYSKLTQYFTNRTDQIYMGGYESKSGKRRKTQKKRNLKLLIKYG